MAADDPRVFVLNASRGFGERVCRHLGVIPARHEEREFEDGEHKARPLENVRGADVFVIQSLYGDATQSVNDKLVRLLFFIGALKDADARRVTVVTPYLAYMRKDRKTKPRDPVSTRYLAGLMEASGADHVVTIDVHNVAAYQNAFRCRTEHLEAKKLFAGHFCKVAGERPLVVVAPDAGGVKRATRFRDTLEQLHGRDIGMAYVEKQRSSGVVSGGGLMGEVAGTVAIVLDDMVSTGTTLQRAARACRERGAVEVHGAATHGLLVAGTAPLFADGSLDSLVITNTISPPDGVAGPLQVLDATPLFAEVMRRLHDGGSLVELFE